MVFRNIARKATDVLYPPEIACLLCGREDSETLTHGVCADCLKTMALSPMHEADSHTASVFVYECKVRDAIHKLKFNGEKSIGKKAFAGFLADKLQSLAWPAMDVIVPVPVHWLRLINRGFNPPGLMAKTLARTLQVRYVPHALRRPRHTRPMFTKESNVRLQTAQTSYAIYRSQGIVGKRVLLIDDITTTGSTGQVCCDLLLKNGATEVYMLTVAKA